MTQNSGHITPGNSAGYTVRSGDTLSDIAQRAYGNGSKAYWMALYVANQDTIGSNPNIIRPGENLRIPTINNNPYADSLYIVKSGDTLFGIAERVENGNEVQSWVETIYGMNELIIGSNRNLIHPGQVLYIPPGGGGGNIH